MPTLITNMNTLKALQRAGHVKLHSDTGKIVGAIPYGKVKAYYVHHETKPIFQHKGKTYIKDYISGCFSPFVYCLS